MSIRLYAIPGGQGAVSPTLTRASTPQRGEGIGATASSLSSLPAAAPVSLSPVLLEQRLIGNACKAIKHVISFDTWGGFDRAIAHYPAMSVKALLVFKVDGKLLATLPGSLESVSGHKQYNQKIVDQLNADRQQMSILRANPSMLCDEFQSMMAKGETATWPTYESAEPQANTFFRESAERIAANIKLLALNQDSKLELILITLDELVNDNRPGTYQIVHFSRLHVTPHDSGNDYSPGFSASWMEGPRNIDFHVEQAFKGCAEAEIQSAKNFFAESQEQVVKG